MNNYISRKAKLISFFRHMDILKKREDEINNLRDEYYSSHNWFYKLYKKIEIYKKQNNLDIFEDIVKENFGQNWYIDYLALGKDDFIKEYGKGLNFK